MLGPLTNTGQISLLGARGEIGWTAGLPQV
jgi:hypothetical protein